MKLNYSNDANAIVVRREKRIRNIFFFISKIWSKYICQQRLLINSLKLSWTHGCGTLNQQTGGVEHLSLVTVGSTCVRPSVVSRDAKDG